ncbi:MAG: hypothetical protein JWL83_3095, partial [Actinomycetia bacterium]|nr:hypothetical protein [Actinomycetes bacterium]
QRYDHAHTECHAAKLGRNAPLKLGIRWER